jgi:hypothetical protein
MTANVDNDDFDEFVDRVEDVGAYCHAGIPLRWLHR